MRKLLYLISFLAFSFSASAQNLSLSYAGGALSNNGNIYVYADSGYYNTMESHVYVTNNSSSSISVKVKKFEVTVIPGSENSFCWETCYIPTVFVSPTALDIAAGATNNENFIGDYKPRGMLGETIIRYTFFNVANTNDSVCVNVHYTATPVAVQTYAATPTLSNAYPNPASTRVSFNYDLKASANEAFIIIKDITGNEVKREYVSGSNGRLSLNVDDLSEGVYFYSLIIDGKAATTKKLIVQK